MPVLGAPGVYVVPTATDQPPGVERLDVAAFVGVAVRGPAYAVVQDPDVLEGEPFRARSVPTPVESWEDYCDLFGGMEGPGLLPHAVASFFAQGGRRAYVVRVVAPLRRPHRTDDHKGSYVLHPGVDRAPLGCARFRVGGCAGWRVWARDEGSWGNRLTVQVRLTVRPLDAVLEPDGSPDGRPTALALPPGVAVLPGATLRATTTDGSSAPEYRRVVALRRPGPGQTGVRALLDAPLDSASTLGVRRFDVVEAELEVTDTDPARPRSEQHAALGLHPTHPRWVVDVVNTSSQLVQMPPGTPPGLPLLDGQQLPSAPGPVPVRHTAAGVDRWEQLRPEDLFGDDDPGQRGGIQAVLPSQVAQEVASLLVPDLYAPGQPAQAAASLPAKVAAGFVPCGPPSPDTEVAPPVVELAGLRLDPTDPADLQQIVERQQRVVAVAEQGGLVAMLDVPPRLLPDQVLSWRGRFDSSYAAAYTPWLSVPDGARGLVRLPPSAPAAGLVAHTELVHGLALAAANEVLIGVVDVERVIGPDEHGILHQRGVNVCRPDVDGIRLTAARTLSTDAAWRQLTVRRLLMVLERTVRRQLQWTVFEPDDGLLRDGVHRQLEGLLGSLFEQGCFAGSTAAESYFVSTTTGRDHAREADKGRLLVEVGVAPAEPLEFIVLRVAVQAEGDLRTAVGGAEVGRRA